MVRNSRRKCPCSPSSPSVYCRGARLRELLKCTLPFPPFPRGKAQIPAPLAQDRQVELLIADCQLRIAFRWTLDVGRWALGVSVLRPAKQSCPPEFSRSCPQRLYPPFSSLCHGCRFSL